MVLPKNNKNSFYVLFVHYCRSYLRWHIFRSFVWEVAPWNYFSSSKQPQKCFPKLTSQIKPFLRSILTQMFVSSKRRCSIPPPLTHFIPIPYLQHFLSGAAETPRIILVRWPRCQLKLAGTENSITDTPRRVKWEVGGPGGKWRLRWVRNGEDRPFPSSWQAGRDREARSEDGPTLKHTEALEAQKEEDEQKW